MENQKGVELSRAMQRKSGFNHRKEVDSFYWLKLHCRDETFQLAIPKFLFRVCGLLACLPEDYTMKNPPGCDATVHWDLLAGLVVLF